MLFNQLGKISTDTPLTVILIRIFSIRLRRPPGEQTTHRRPQARIRGAMRRHRRRLGRDKSTKPQETARPSNKTNHNSNRRNKNLLRKGATMEVVWVTESIMAARAA